MSQAVLTSRERVLRTLRHEPVDRVPIDLGSHMSTGISAFAYWHLREHLGLSTDHIWVPDLVQFLAYVDEDVRQRLHCDCVLLEPPWTRTTRWAPRGRYRFVVPAEFRPRPTAGAGWAVTRGEQTMRMPEGGYFFDGAWLSSWETCGPDETIALYAREAERIYQETPYATNFVGYSRGLGFGGYFGGIEHAISMKRDREAARQALLAQCDRQIAHFQRINRAFGQYLQLLSIGDDMGMQSGPLANPELIHDVCGPAYTRFCRFVHDHSDIKVFMHNCGSIRRLLPYICAWGVDVINPVQIASAGMVPEELVDQFGDRLVFWGGGCCTQTVLGTAPPQAVTEHVTGLVQTFGRKHGYVFNQVHNIMGDVPPANIVAMFDAAYAAGGGTGA